MDDVEPNGVVAQEQDEALRKNIREQLADPGRRNKDHVRLSTIWETTQNIRKIKAQLAQGYSFDKAKLTEMVEAMFSFINAVVDPSINSEDKGVDVTVEKVTQ